MFKYVAHADARTVRECGRVAAQWLGPAVYLTNDIKYNVNVSHDPMFVAHMPNGDLGGFIIANKKRTNAEISWLYVDKGLHGMRIRTRLLMHMQDYLRDVGVRHVRLLSRPSAIPFYMAHGYTPICPDSRYLQKSL